MKCAYCGGQLSKPRITERWDIIMSNPETGELYPPDSAVMGFKCDCLRCKRGYASLDGKRFFSKATPTMIIEAKYQELYTRY